MSVYEEDKFVFLLEFRAPIRIIGKFEFLGF